MQVLLSSFLSLPFERICCFNFSYMDHSITTMKTHTWNFFTCRLYVEIETHMTLTHFKGNVQNE